jgi:oxygen-independent coproporphyrinogen-3 oxidase
MKNEQPGLYIHIPFCKSKCGYCSFYSVASPDRIPEFVKAIVRETGFYKSSFVPLDPKTVSSSEINANLSFPRRRESSFLSSFIDSSLRNGAGEYLFKDFDTIYFGGGTPSLLSITQVSNILEAAGRHFAIAPNAEITIEINPGDVTPAYFRGLKAVGINRLNIGVQSFDDDLLKFLGRRHSATEALAAIDDARNAGCQNIGLDLIYGVSGQDTRLWIETLKEALSFSPEHLSCYQLSLDEKTPLYRRYQQAGTQMPSENEALDFFMTTSRVMADAGYIHYEVSNFARAENLRSRHNMKYWRHIPYLGLGPAAHSFCDRRRWWNTTDVDTYIGSLSEGKTPIGSSEELSTEQLAMEALFLGLRTKDGIDLGRYQARYGLDLLEQKKQTLHKLVEESLVEIKDGCLRPTLSGMAVADSLALI